MAFLETPRLLFRAHEPRDEEHFVQMQMNPEVRRYVGGRAWTHEEAMRRFRQGYLNKPSDASNLCATELKAENRYIGFCGIRRDDPASKCAHLGYYIDQPYWGRGLATEATAAFIELAFSRFNLAELVAEVDHRHEASIHILHKFGFVPVRAEEVAAGRVIDHFRLHKIAVSPDLSK